MLERNAGVSPERRIEFRIGIHLGDIVEESDGDLMGDGVNIAARIEGLAKPGAICLSEDAYRQIKSRLDLAVTNLGERQLKNIAEPIRLYSLEVGKPALVKPSERVRPFSPPAAPRLSVVVLPFANLGGDPEQEHFVDGVTESLTTDLSRLSGATVIARNTAFTYKGKHIDVKQIGRDLNIRYVLEGSVQRGGDRLRVNVQLIDLESGAHVCAERFDKPVADLFDMQDEIVARLANALHAQLTALEARRAEQSPNPDSMDYYFQGMAWANKGVTPHNFTKARACFESALALDPSNVDALVGLGRVDAEMVGAGLADDRVARLSSAEAALNKALSLAPNHPWAHTWMGLTYIHTRRGQQAIAEAERALALDRNLAHARGGVLATANISVGRAEQVEGLVKEAIRLSPRDKDLYIWTMLAGMGNLCLANDDAAVTWLRRSVEANRNLPITLFWLASALANLGRQDDATATVDAALALDPSVTVGRLQRMLTGMSDNPTFQAQISRVLEGLRKAGFPEG